MFASEKQGLDKNLGHIIYLFKNVLIFIMILFNSTSELSYIEMEKLAYSLKMNAPFKNTPFPPP